jgi:hypothetical protein
MRTIGTRIPTLFNMMPWRHATLALTLLAAVSLGACGSSSSTPPGNMPGKASLDTHRVALAIEQSILSERHIHAKVTCPAAEPQQKGHDFVCFATTGKATTPFAVTQTNNNGWVTYHSTTPGTPTQTH